MTRLGAKIAVEPLDDERYARVEGQVMAAYQAMDMAPRRSWLDGVRRLAPAMAAVCAAVLLLYLGGRWFGSPEPTPGSTTIAQSARITTDQDGATHYQIGDADIALGADGTPTTVDVRLEPAAPGAASDHEVHVDLAAGTIDCQVDPIPGRAPFIVHAGDIDVTVVGTGFRVERDDTVRVSVTHGKVRVDGPDGAILLGPGESWSGPALLAENRSGGQGRGGASDRARDGATSDGSDTTIGDDPDGATGDEGNAVAGDGPGLASRDRGTVVPELGGRSRGEGPNATDQTRPRGQEKRTRSEDSGRSSKSSERTPRGPRARELASARPERGRPPAGSEDLAAAFALEKHDPEAAVERYAKLALGRGAEAEFALYSKAYLQHLRLGQSSAALTTLGHYQKRFSRGVQSESATWLRIHILCQKKDLKPCRAAAHSYLSQYKNGRHRDLAGRMIHWGM